MKKNVLLSIIIPVFNGEKYILKCIESILNQKDERVEIIIINDGSTDRTKQILEEYNLFSDFNIINQDNNGVSNARNKGILIAKGKYLWFVDADDYIVKGAILPILNFIENENFDLLLFNYVRSENENKISALSSKYETMTKSNTLKDILNNNSIAGYLWNKIFRKDLILSNNLFFDNQIFIMEDEVFVIEYLFKCNIIKKNESAIYVYTENLFGATSDYGIKKELSTIRARKKILTLICSHDIFIDSLFLKREKKILLESILDAYKRLYFTKAYENRNVILKELKEDYVNYKGNDKYRWKIKIKLKEVMLKLTNIRWKKN